MKCAVVMLVLSIATGCLDSGTKGDPAKSYQGHRVAVWAVNKDTGKLTGFAEGKVTPGGTLSLEPIKGYTIRIDLGPVKDETLTDFRREWKVPMVSVKSTHGTGSSEGVTHLDEVRLNVEWGINEPTHTVVAMIPIGTAKLPGVPEKFAGTLEELEDIVLAAAKDGTLELNRAVEVYTVLRATTRQKAWAALASAEDKGPATIAIAVLALTGQADAQKIYCDLCLSSKGNQRVELVEQLPNMPVADVFLQAMIRVLAMEGELRTQVPENVGVGDEDRRHGLGSAIRKNYAEGQVRAAIDKVIGEIPEASREAARKQIDHWLK